jgi:hypothetical protein
MMRTLAKRRSLVKQAELEAELRDLLALVEAELYRAGAELDRYYAELQADTEREAYPSYVDVVR